MIRARAEGKTLGRPKLDERSTNAIRLALANGDSIRKFATAYKVSVGTVHRIKVEIADVGSSA